MRSMRRKPLPDVPDNQPGTRPDVVQLRDGTLLFTFRIVTGPTPNPTATLVVGCDVEGELTAAIYDFVR